MEAVITVADITVADITGADITVVAGITAAYRIILVADILEVYTMAVGILV